MPDVYDDADLYAAAFDWPVDFEIDWLLKHVGPVRSVLEPFCGHARHGPHFVRRGIRYCGFDRSEAMIRRAEARRCDGLEVFVADARDFAAPDQMFDLGWCPINSLAHLTDEGDVVSHLQCMRRHLRAGAWHVIELELVNFDGPGQDGPFSKSKWSMPQPDGTVVRAEWGRVSSDRASRLCEELAVIRRCRGDLVVCENVTRFPMRMWTLDDLHRISSMCGFQLERCHIHDEKAGNPPAALDASLENNGENLYLFLRLA